MGFFLRRDKGVVDMCEDEELRCGNVVLVGDKSF